MDRETENQELDLVEASRAGNRQSFGELVRRHQNLVCAMAFSGLGDVAQSEDVAQEVFIAASAGLVALIVFGPGLSKAHPAWYIASVLALPAGVTVAHSFVFLRGHRRLERLRQEERFARGEQPEPQVRRPGLRLPPSI
jgi:hypothetical protein